jgi:pimeloyl-ACP methyl ester carboxylesterase
VFSGLSPEHANPAGLARRFQLQTLKPLARHFTVYAVNRKPGLVAGSTIKDLAGHYAEAIAHEFPGPVSVEGISTGGSIAQQFAIGHPQLVRRLVLAVTACRLSAHGRETQRRFAELTKAGQPRRAHAALGPTLAATAAGGRAFAIMMWLFAASQRAEDPSDMLVTVAAEDAFDASPSWTASPPRPCWSPAVGTGTTPRSCSGRPPSASPTPACAGTQTRATPAC